MATTASANNVADCTRTTIVNEIDAVSVNIDSDVSHVNRIIYKGAEVTAGQSPFENIVNSAWARINQVNSQQHVSTRAERSVMRLFTSSGSVYIEGKSGSGKSRLAIRLMSKISKETGRTPIILSAWQQWDVIPKRSANDSSGPSEKFIVLIDDIYGTSNLDPQQVVGCERYFDMMWPHALPGDIFFVLTSRSDISALCNSKVKTSPLIRKAIHIDLDGSKYSLTASEKRKMLRKVCKVDFSVSELETLTETEVSLGFPQCCTYFSNSTRAQEKSVSFFHNPLEFILEDVDTLHECDGLGYLVLLIVLMSKGYLNEEMLCPFQRPITTLIQSLQQCCSGISEQVTLADINKKAEALCDVYLLQTDSGYMFQHQSVSDAMFISISKKYPDICIDTCPADILVELVRTHAGDTDGLDTTLCLSEQYFPDFAHRLTEILMSDEYETILHHPSFHHKEFVQFLVNTWTGEKCKILLHEHKPTAVSVDHPVVLLQTYPLFEHSVLLSDIILKKMMLVLQSVCLEELDISVHLPNCLACAIYTEDNDLIRDLLSMGADPNEDCFRALCQSPNIEERYTDAILSRFENRLEGVSNLDHLFGIAVMSGSTKVVNLLVKLLKGERRHVIQLHLEMLLKKFVKIPTDPALIVPGDIANYVETVDVLSSASDDIDLDYLVWLTAAHSDATILRCFLQNPKCDPLKTYRGSSLFLDTTSLQQAAAFGGAECVDLLIEFLQQKGVPPADFLNESEPANYWSPNLSALELAIQYNDSSDVIIPLLHAGADVIRKNSLGQTMLHIAAARMHVGHVKTLLNAGASVCETSRNGKTAFTDLYPYGFPHTESDTHVEIVKAFIEAGSDVNELDFNDRCCLLKAAAYQDFDTVRYLCGKGADLNQKDADGKPVLFDIVSMCELEMIKHVITLGTDVSVLDCNGRSVMHYAGKSETAAVDLIFYFKDVHNIPLDGVDNLGRNVLFYAAGCGDEEVAELLVDMGLDVNTRDTDGTTPLHIACGQHDSISDPRINTCIVKFLLERCANPRVQDAGGDTPLHYAVSVSVTSEIVDLLLEGGADPNIHGRFGCTPLHCAVQERSQDIITTLIANGGDLSAKDFDDCAPLHYAARSSNGRENVKLLLEKAGNPDIKDRSGCTPLHYAAKSWGTGMAMTSLVEGGADVGAKDRNGCTPLHYAAQQRDCKDNVKLLLQGGADIWAQDKDGRTPVHYAAEQLYCDGNLKNLLEKMDGPLPRDKDGCTPLHYAARERDCVENLQVLLDNGVDAGAQDGNGRAALHYAAGVHGSRTVKMLLENGSPPSTQDKDGCTPLHFAAKVYDCEENVKILLDKGADPNVEDRNGCTALQYALSSGCEDNVTALLDHCRCAHGETVIYRRK
ncbi:uncharacterized protein LOC124264283 [Haliotis rubra]|uniref:uncharacterized protein LOC124264283 n=1 Tax=Haliotis rubra TaxID=36100 RepID=UPI001EE5F4D7|nr:uncharacterized protein LOC124264283 [Haliotis rubra]XP_046554979.1 uncharacterized protein LOC124264283 [Haliotis rubra]